MNESLNVKTTALGPDMTGSSTSSSGEKIEGLSIFRALNVLLQHWRLIAVLPIAFALLAIALCFLRPRTFTTTASFVPEGSGSAQSQLSGLASQFGVSLSSGDNAGQSPRFYESLLETGDLLGAVVDSTYEYRDGTRQSRAPLTSILQSKGATPELRRAHAIKEVKKWIATTTDKETGVVRLTVQSPWPLVSKQVAERLLGLVNNFNLLQRQRQAVAERAFVEDRLNDAQAQLRESEDALQQFLERNRQYAGDPQLMATHDRLERTVALRQQVYASLAQMYEQASLTAMRNTPLIAVVEQPRVAAEPDARGLAAKAILAFVFGAIVAIVIAFARSAGARARQEAPEEFASVLDLYHNARRDMSRLWRWRASA